MSDRDAIPAASAETRARLDAADDLCDAAHAARRFESTDHYMNAAVEVLAKAADKSAALLRAAAEQDRTPPAQEQREADYVRGWTDAIDNAADHCSQCDQTRDELSAAYLAQPPDAEVKPPPPNTLLCPKCRRPALGPSTGEWLCPHCDVVFDTAEGISDAQ